MAFSNDLGTPPTWGFYQDVGGRYVGPILGWGNMWGNLGAAFGQRIYNYILGEAPGVSDWNNMFIVCMGASLFSCLCALGVDATVPIDPPDEEHNDETFPRRLPS